jgi:hypothetical protein
MKILITESQHKMLMEEQKVLHIPSMKIFDNDSVLLQRFLEKKGYPPYSIGGNLNLYGSRIKSLENLRSVGGYLDLQYSDIEFLGSLQSVGGYLDLQDTEIESLGNLRSVGGDLFLRNTPLSKKYTVKKIRQMVQVDGNIIMW